jgi:hypothetical protein
VRPSYRLHRETPVLVWAADTDVLMRSATLSLVLLWLIALSPKVGDQLEPLVEE